MFCYISAKQESERLLKGSVHANREEFWQTKIIICVCLAFVFNPLFSWVWAGEVKKQDGELFLEAGTPILLRFKVSVTSEGTRVGQMVGLEVAEDVYSNGRVVIRKGTPAEGQIIRCETRQYAGEPGVISIANFFVLPRNNEKIRLDGVLRIGGEDKPESRVLGYCCLFGYLIKGGSALIEEGQTVRTVLARDCII